ncbi:MAG: hypothetical protein C5B50_03565 [Verrucomicrobia bacterium]|nr:MAG: hypothetical protein C5B50_03565 [Verrucomicrobiota bacterium]
MNTRRILIGLDAAILTGFLFGQSAGAAQFTTSDGRTYNDANVEQVEPDGLLVKFQPPGGGFGIVKLKFRNLPDSVRSQYSYDADRASKYEADQAQAAARYRSQFIAADSLRQLRILAELHRSLAGDAVSSYTITMDANGKVSAQGFTGNVVPYLLPYSQVVQSPGDSKPAPAQQ